ncbi:MAG: sugar phosphate nucleotidyltransferase [Vicinamibacterales bacterium]
MKAVILARGLARRMRAAEDGARLEADQAAAAASGQKAMMPIGARRADGRLRPFLDFVLSELADAGCGQVGLVIGPEHDAIRAWYTTVSPPERVRVHFLVQPEPLGTANAVLAAEAWVGDDPFLVLNADNLYPAAVLRALVALDEPGLPGFEQGDLIARSGIPAERIGSFALLECTADGYLSRIVEKPGAAVMAAAGDRALVSMNIWRFDRAIFDACRQVPRSARGEFELPEAVALAVRQGARLRVLPSTGEILDLSRRGDVDVVARRLAGREARP